jgi:hypothetical protein
VCVYDVSQCSSEWILLWQALNSSNEQRSDSIDNQVD